MAGGGVRLRWDCNRAGRRNRSCDAGSGEGGGSVWC